MTAQDVVKLLANKRLPLQDEKMLQRQLANILYPDFEPEYFLDQKNIIDFLDHKSHVGVEVKIKGSRRSIYTQCHRYCQFRAIQSFVLVTNRAMGLPPFINDKPCYVVNLGKAWL